MTIEDNKRRAERGWIADPPPETPEPLSSAHIHKWPKIMGAKNLLKKEGEKEG